MSAWSNLIPRVLELEIVGANQSLMQKDCAEHDDENVDCGGETVVMRSTSMWITFMERNHLCGASWQQLNG